MHAIKHSNQLTILRSFHDKIGYAVHYVPLSIARPRNSGPWCLGQANQRQLLTVQELQLLDALISPRNCVTHQLILLRHGPPAWSAVEACSVGNTSLRVAFYFQTRNLHSELLQRSCGAPSHAERRVWPSYHAVAARGAGQVLRCWQNYSKLEAAWIDQIVHKCMEPFLLHCSSTVPLSQ
jgi:hypothetical protein